ncbi:MAG: hypothetical protein HY22_12290 [[Candidatus Thermochlorobacteriaceae] bacterium GBChlB]|nr:MAG: hypothetical protein HY22_12290 [[Candidatus Thermochlorobacteriaceae] bacterium GBChlB]
MREHRLIHTLKAQLVIVTGVLALYVWLGRAWLLYTALALGLAFVFLPRVGEWSVKGWFKLAEVLGWINSRVLLSAIYFLVLFPIALLHRIQAKDALTLRRTTAQTLFRTRQHRFQKSDLDKLW